MKLTRYIAVLSLLACLAPQPQTVQAAKCGNNEVGTKLSIPSFGNLPTFLQHNGSGLPLVVMLHGRNSCVASFQEQTGFANSSAVNVLWLSGASMAGEQRQWVAYGSNSATTYAYVRAAVGVASERVKPNLTIAAGMSMGGSMALAAVCKMPDVFDAAISVAGASNIPCGRIDRGLLVIGGDRDTAQGVDMPNLVASRWTAESISCEAPVVVRSEPVVTATEWDCVGGVRVGMTVLHGVGHVWPLFGYYNVNLEMVRFIESLTCSALEDDSVEATNRCSDRLPAVG